MGKLLSVIGSPCRLKARRWLIRVAFHTAAAAGDRGHLGRVGIKIRSFILFYDWHGFFLLSSQIGDAYNWFGTNLGDVGSGAGIPAAVVLGLAQQCTQPHEQVIGSISWISVPKFGVSSCSTVGITYILIFRNQTYN
jgi:hypothetical protein